MGDRWRDRLRELDKAGPSEAVFERAKSSPARAEEPLPRTSTSTRVVTGVVAFAFFALALSAIAIPALRTHTTAADGSAADVVALWPARTTDDVRTLQRSADAGNAGWALDPQALAAKFGRDVMGWPGAVATRSFGSYCFDPGFGASGAPVPCDQLSVGGWSVPAGVPPGLESPTGGVDGGSVRAYAVFPCDPKSCDLTQPPEWVQLYQPLQQDEDGVWTVLEVTGSSSLSVSPFQVVHEGATVSMNVMLDPGLRPTLAYGACGVTNGTSDPTNDYGNGDVVIDADVHLGTPCDGSQPGYVWAATADGPLVNEGRVADPFNGGAPALASLTAVPATIVFSSSDEVPAPSTPAPGMTPNVSPSMPPLTWTSFSDPYGWTMDVPASWDAHVITTKGAGAQGARFAGPTMSVQLTTQTAEKGSSPPGLTFPATPDSTFPLDPVSLFHGAEGGLDGEFYGDGQQFSLYVQSATLPGPLSETDQAILDRMIGSISFEPWSLGDVRHDWVAIATATRDVSWLEVEGGLYILFRTADGYRLYGSISCAGKPPAKTGVTSDGSAKLSCPDGSTWETTADGASGGSGDAVKNDPPPEWPVTTAHDGTLIAYVWPNYFPPGTGGAGGG